MSDIKLTQIIAPELGSDSYGANIKKQFENIDSNFTQIVEGEYLKGQSGDIVMLEEIDLTSTENHEIREAFDNFIGGLQVGENGIGDINSSKLYMIYTKNEETNNLVYKTSLPYTFLDPRFNPVSDSVKDENSEDKSCIIIYDGDTGESGEFKSYNAFPNIYFNGDQNEFCWKINGLPTSLPARGPKGDTGYTGAVYILSAILPENYNPQIPQSVKVNFLIKPPKYSEFKDSNITNEVALELKGQAAFVYVNLGEKQYIYISQIETSIENEDIYAVCHLDNSCEIHQIFANQTLKDVLTEVKPDSDFNYLFIPSKFNNGVLEEAHVVTTKRSGDKLHFPTCMPSNDIDKLKDNDYPNCCIISSAKFDNNSQKRNINEPNGFLYFGYPYTICQNLYTDCLNATSLKISDDAVFKNISVSESLISSNLYKDKNNVTKPWIELVEPLSTSSYVFPNTYVDEDTINEMYIYGVEFTLTFSIGELNKTFTFRKSGDDRNGYDVLLDSISISFNEFIEYCKESDPLNPSCQWNPEAEVSDGLVKMRYEGDFFELQDPKELIIQVSAADFELTCSYNPKDLAQANKIKINGNVEIPGTVKVSDLLFGNQTLDNRIDNKIDNKIDVANQSLLEKYFTEINACGGVTFTGSTNVYGESYKIFPGYRHPIQLWESKYYPNPQSCEYQQSSITPTYQITIDLTGVQNFISCLQFKTKFKTSGTVIGPRIFIQLNITDLNGKKTVWIKSQTFYVGTYDVDAIITFKNDEVKVTGGFMQQGGVVQPL